MARIEKTVFISYRRTNLPWALAISQDLAQNGFDVFLDYTGIASGDFGSVILENIHSRAHFIVLLTPSALERCGEPGDWLRREIEAALASRRNIVPVTLEGFSFGTPAIGDQLTGKLAVLKEYNAVIVPPEYFYAAMAKLRQEFLNVPLDAVLHPASLTAQQAATQQKGAAARAPRVAKNELTAQQWFERGVNATEPDEEIRFYSEAIRLKPDYAEAFNNRGIARKAKGDLDGAIADFNQAIRLQPDCAETFCVRGLARDAKGDLDGAIADYNQATLLKPDFAYPFFFRGIARKVKGDPDGAIADFNETIRLKPDHAASFHCRGLARRKKGDLGGALADYDQAIRLNPDDAIAFNNRGNARDDKGDSDGALADYDEAIRLQPDYADAFNNRGAARWVKGDLDLALADYNQAIRLQPDHPLALRNREFVRQAVTQRSRT
jgi:tetratricopeptide (TPR) repeat protein